MWSLPQEGPHVSKDEMCLFVYVSHYVKVWKLNLSKHPIRAELWRRKGDVLKGNLQMFPPEMYPGSTILGPPPMGRHKT